MLREGHDGADLALENVLSSENVEERFSEVVIVSGDGLFANQAARLRSLGVRVTVDARNGVAAIVGLRVLAYALARLPRLLLLLRVRLPLRLLLRRCLRPAIVLTSHLKPPLRIGGGRESAAQISQCAKSRPLSQDGRLGRLLSPRENCTP